MENEFGMKCIDMNDYPKADCSRCIKNDVCGIKQLKQDKLVKIDSLAVYPESEITISVFCKYFEPIRDTSRG